jgi:hypothetical protein
MTLSATRPFSGGARPEFEILHRKGVWEMFKMSRSQSTIGNLLL